MDALRELNPEVDVVLVDLPIRERLDAAGLRPTLGRTTGTTQDTVVEVGSDPASWALLPVDQIAGAGSTRVRSIPLHPPLAVTGHVITAENGSLHACLENAVAAFRDRPEVIPGPGHGGVAAV